MTDTPAKKSPAKDAPKQHLVMLVELDPNEMILIDSQHNEHTCRSAEEFWDTAKRLLHNDEAPALTSAPGEGKKKADPAAPRLK